MRRGSAVLLTILPLLSPSYALPTFFGNDGAVAHANIERAAVPEAALTFDDGSSTSNVEGSIPNLKRQLGGGGADSSGSTVGSVSLDAPNDSATSGASSGPARISIDYNSEGSDHWLLPPGKREIEEREAKAEAEAKPEVTLDLDYVPPELTVSDIDLGPLPLKARSRKLAL
ncbi:MAG: hypothetical protein LQ338_000502 [Usnochroma carphineum]|nr:MAG: hypothetical protein LQ338_000502 [Usnochroma carphineum]